MNKVEGKVSDWCLKCKNCKAVTRMHGGKNASIRIIEVECEDPYDGMTKTLDADSDIRCSMFESKKEKESFNLNMPREAIKAIAKLNDVICELEKEKAAHLKGIERLKKTQEKLQNQVKNLQTTNEESYKREEKLEEKFKEANELADSWKRDYEFVRDQLIHPIYDILYPDNPNRDINVTALLDDVKNLKIYEDENKSMYEDLKYWKERCHKAETDVTILNSKVETLKNKKDNYLKKIADQQVTHYKQCARILELENMVNKLQSGEYDDILAKDIEIKSLQDKYEAAMAGWKGSMDTNDRLDQTISDLKEKNENLTKAVERRDKWVEELKSDVDTLQNECLSIAEIAKRAYDETNRD